MPTVADLEAEDMDLSFEPEAEANLVEEPEAIFLPLESETMITVDETNISLWFEIERVGMIIEAYFSFPWSGRIRNPRNPYKKTGKKWKKWEEMRMRFY